MSRFQHVFLGSFLFSTLALAACGGAPAADDEPVAGSEGALTESSHFETGYYAGADGDPGTSFWEVISGNGSVVLSSQVEYKSADSLTSAMADVAKYGRKEANYKVEEIEGEFIVKLENPGNNHVYGTTDSYASERNANEGIERLVATMKSVKENGIPDVKGTRFTTFESKKNQRTYVNLLAANGEIVLAGCGGDQCGYTDKSGASAGIESIKANGGKKTSYEPRDGAAPYFVLKAQNGQIIGKSQMYSSPGARDKGIEAAMAAVNARPSTETINVRD